MQEAHHIGWDKVADKRRGAAYYDSLSEAAKQRTMRDLIDYKKGFDAKYETNLRMLLYRTGLSTNEPAWKASDRTHGA